jgi:hypothetical protein
MMPALDSLVAVLQAGRIAAEEVVLSAKRKAEVFPGPSDEYFDMQKPSTASRETT